VAIYRFTVHVSCINQRDGLCLHSLHGGIFGALSDVCSVCKIFKMKLCSIKEVYG